MKRLMADQVNAPSFHKNTAQKRHVKNIFWYFQLCILQNAELFFYRQMESLLDIYRQVGYNENVKQTFHSNGGGI